MKVLLVLLKKKKKLGKHENLRSNPQHSYWNQAQTRVPVTSALRGKDRRNTITPWPATLFNNKLPVQREALTEAVKWQRRTPTVLLWLPHAHTWHTHLHMTSKCMHRSRHTHTHTCIHHTNIHQTTNEHTHNTQKLVLMRILTNF